ncbi:MAG: class I SAM-dependent DNA methyltransferase, partial [Anaerolineae bacterium]|nr:class I SAM-dependent DNA methyltransferase [Anaerolineae bacterium]
MTPEEFYERWRNTTLNERQSYQAHFMDVCRLVGYDLPGGTGTDARGQTFTFEYSLKKDSGGQGYADVFLAGHFAIEYKAPGKYKDLREAYQQLQQYREKLDNPPLLVVTDIDTWVIHTNFQNTEKREYPFRHEELLHNPRVREYLEALFFAPERLHPRRNTEEVTRDAAAAFKLIADNMREWHARADHIAGFLTRLVFCLFAEDVLLLPVFPATGEGIFSQIVEQTRTQPAR